MGKDVWSYARFAVEVDRLARGLIARGLRRGDRVALHLFNGPELAVAYHACFRIGAIAAPLNTRLKSAELDPLLRRLRPALYIGQANLYAKVAGVDPMNLPVNARFLVDGGVTDLRVQPWTTLFTDIIAGSLPALVDTGAPALLLTTSGTTGEPKFVCQTLATMGKIAEESRHWGLESGHIALAPCPWFIPAAPSPSVGDPSDMPLVLVPQFDAEAVLAIAQHAAAYFGMPFMLRLCWKLNGPARGRSTPAALPTAGDVAPRLQESFPSFRDAAPLHLGRHGEASARSPQPASGPVHRIVGRANPADRRSRRSRSARPRRRADPARTQCHHRLLDRPGRMTPRHDAGITLEIHASGREVRFCSSHARRN
jgi:hypothetical protein